MIVLRQQVLLIKWQPSNEHGSQQHTTDPANPQHSLRNVRLKQTSFTETRDGDKSRPWRTDRVLLLSTGRRSKVTNSFTVDEHVRVVLHQHRVHVQGSTQDSKYSPSYLKDKNTDNQVVSETEVKSGSVNQCSPVPPHSALFLDVKLCENVF